MTKEEILQGTQSAPTNPAGKSELCKEELEDRALIEKAARLFCKEINLTIPKINYTSNDYFVGYAQTYHRAIRISRWWLSRASTHDMIETVQHELLHLKCRRHGHGERYQRLCQRHGVDGRAESPIMPFCMNWVHYVRED